MGKGRLSKSEKYIIEGMFQDGHPLDEISDEVGRSTETIEKYLASLVGSEDNEEPEPQIKKNTTQFIRQTAAKRNKGVSIMTEAESSRSELTKPKNQSKIMKRLYPNIHKIVDNDG